VASFYQYAIALMWALWALYWSISAANVKPTAQREPASARAIHLLLMIICFALLAAPPRIAHTGLFGRFIPADGTVHGLGILIVVSGLLLAVWARIHLGTNWSGRVSVKENHELIQSGPYRRIRHPIYTGLLLAMLGTALAIGQWRGLIAVALMGITYWRKLQLEEAVMLRTFGEVYVRYAEHTAALIPYVI
jgi:protein-S-isoprenylcysteine O-methyltransferase Ste14